MAKSSTHKLVDAAASSSIVKQSTSKSKSAKSSSTVDEVPTEKTPLNGPEDLALTSQISETKKLKRSKAGKEPEAPQDEVSLPQSTKKEKKRKRRDGESGNSRTAESQDENTTSEPPQKKHKNRTEFEDPRSDLSLNNQSRKALEYASTQMNKPHKWKFNKARQNWIIRNVWSPEVLPDTYFPLALIYLSKMQGGSREKLMQSCRLYLKVEEDTPPDASSSEPEGALSDLPETTPVKGILKTALKPGPLIPSTPTAGTLISSDSVSIATKTPAPDAAAAAAVILAETRRSRALKLLDVLSTDT